jgi:hypothetical protein
MWRSGSREARRTDFLPLAPTHESLAHNQRRTRTPPVGVMLSANFQPIAAMERLQANLADVADRREVRATSPKRAHGIVCLPFAGSYELGVFTYPSTL